MFDFDDLAEEPADPTQVALAEGEDFVRCGSLGAVVHWASSDRAPLAVVLVPGNPGVDSLVHSGRYHANAPGIQAIKLALRKAKIAYLSFDYAGIGLSAAGGPTADMELWKAPSEEATIQSVWEAVLWARSCLSDCLVACCWNFGACYAGEVALAPEGLLQGIVSVSMGYNVYLSYLVRKDPISVAVGNDLKERYERWNSGLRCKTLYIVGSMDKSMTPLGHVKRLVRMRPDGGAEAKIHVIEQKEMKMTNDEYFQLLGSTSEVGAVVSEWLQEQFQEVLGPADARLMGA